MWRKVFWSFQPISETIIFRIKKHLWDTSKLGCPKSGSKVSAHHHLNIFSLYLFSRCLFALYFRLPFPFIDIRPVDSLFSWYLSLHERVTFEILVVYITFCFIVIHLFARFKTLSLHRLEFKHYVWLVFFCSIHFAVCRYCISLQSYILLVFK